MKTNSLDKPATVNQFKDITSGLGYESLDYSGSIRFFEHGSPSNLIRWHQHEEFELHLITESQGQVFVGDYIGQFEPGHLALIGSNLPHNWVSDHSHLNEEFPKRDRLIQFDANVLRKATRNIPELSAVNDLLERAGRGVEFLKLDSRIYRDMDSIKSLEGFDQYLAFLTLLGKLARHNSYQLLASEDYVRQSDHNCEDFVIEAVKHVSEHYYEPISMAELALYYEIPASRFSKAFKKATGHTFTDFITRIRIEQACRLLRETDQFVQVISEQVGFHNLANFNRRFRAVTGFTASDFRRGKGLAPQNLAYTI